jgi:hypothetical protein
VAVWGKNGIKGYKARNYEYQLSDKESIRGMVILLGITTSWTRNPPEEWLFEQELSAQRRGIHAPK